MTKTTNLYRNRSAKAEVRVFMSKFIATVLMFLLLGPINSQPGHAYQTCEQLYDGFRASKRNSSSAEANLYFGFVMGATMSWLVIAKIVNHYPPPLEDKSFYQVANVVGQWLDRHPEKWDSHPFECIMLGVQDAWMK